MRRYAIVLGIAAALAAATAAPAAAHTISPTSYAFTGTNPIGSTLNEGFTVTAQTSTLNGSPAVVGGDTSQFSVNQGDCDGSLLANQSCTFYALFEAKTNGNTSAVVGIPGGPTATVTATVGPISQGNPGSKGKKKGCKKKGKKGAAAAKKKKCGKKK